MVFPTIAVAGKSERDAARADDTAGKSTALIAGPPLQESLAR